MLESLVLIGERLQWGSWGAKGRVECGMMMEQRTWGYMRVQGSAARTLKRMEW